MPAVVTKMWSPPTITLASGGFQAQECYQVSAVTSSTDAVGAVVAQYPETAHNAQHPLNPYLYCSGKSASMDGFNFYKVTVTYASTPSGRHVNPGDPLNEPIRWRWEPINIAEPVDSDEDGNIIADTVGEPFSNPDQSQFQAVRIYATRNEAYFRADFALQYGNSVGTTAVSFNNGQWAVDPGESFCWHIRPLTEITSAAPFVTVEYCIELRGGLVLDPDGQWDSFKRRVMVLGRRAYYDATHTGPIVELVNGQAQNVAMDVRLKADGTPYKAEYKVGKPTGGAVAPVASPYTPPSSQCLEVTSIATFLKYYPRGVSREDHRAMGLP